MSHFYKIAFLLGLVPGLRHVTRAQTKDSASIDHTFQVKAINMYSQMNSTLVSGALSDDGSKEGSP